MAGLANNTLANPGNSFYAPAGESARNWYQFPSLNGSVLLNDASGTQVLQAVQGDLFFNQELLAKAGDIQDIADWALYPALADVEANGKQILDVSSIAINNSIVAPAATMTIESLTASQGITSQANIITPTLQIAGAAIPSIGQITTSTLAASGQVQAGSVTSSGAISGTAITGTSLKTTGGLDMTNSGITRASSVGISAAGLAPYGALTSPDGVMLTWNGQTITTGGGGNVANWSSFPALTDVDLSSQNINNAQDIFSVLTQSNVLAAGDAVNGKFVTTNSNSITGSTTDGLTISSRAGQPLALSSGTSITETGDAYTLTVDKGASLLTAARINMTAQNGNGGAINLTANGGFGVGPAQIGFGAVEINALGADNGVFNLGGKVDITAYSGGVGEYGGATSRVSLSAATVALSAGAAPVLPGLAGSMNLFGQGAVSIVASLLPPILPQFPETVYMYGLGIPNVAGGVRLESPNGIQMLSDTYIENLYPLDGNGLTIQGRSLPDGDVTILDCAGLTMTASGNVTTDFIDSLSDQGIFYKDNLQPQTASQGIFSNFLRPPQATGAGTPNLVITNNPFLGTNNYVEISGADVIAFAPTGAGALSGVQSINGATWPPPTGDASLWSQYPATSIIDVSGFGLTKVGDLSGVVNINGSAYPPVVSSDDWSLFPALQDVDISGYGLLNLQSISMPNLATITSLGSLGLFADTSSGNISIATNGGGSVNIGTGNAGDINIQTIGAGNDLNLAGDTASITAAVKINLDTPILDVLGADIQNVSNITNEATNLLTVQSTVNLTVSAETALTLVSDSADVTVQGQTGVSVYAATGNVNLTADSGEVIVQDSLLNMNSHKVTNLTPGTVGTDAVNYTQLTFRDNTEFYVSAQGSDISGNGSILAPFQTIQKAITAAELISSASSICNINVASGNYPQSLTFNKGYVVLNGTLQSQTGNEVCEITGSITINCTGANDVFNRQVAFQGFNITCGAGQSITNTSASSHTVSFQDCKIFVNSVCYNSTASCADARTYFTNVEISSTNAANVSPVITTNVGLVELERMDFTVDGNAIGILIGGTSVLNRFSLSTLESTNTGATLLPLLSFTSTTTSVHSLGNVAFAFSSATAKTATNAVYINSGINTAIIALNNVFTLAGTASSTNNCVGYNGVGSPTIAGVNNTSLNVNVLLPQTVSVQSGITQISYTDINPPVMACYSTTGDQTITAVNTPQAVTFNTTQFNQGTALVATTRFYVSSQGNYQITWSLMMSHSSGTALMTSFLKKNGTTVANTGSQTTTFSGGTSIVQVSPNFILSLNAGDYVELFVASNALGSTINSTGAINGNAATPGAVFNITQIR